MNFNKHYNLDGLHAFLSPSSFYWLNYDDARLIEAHRNFYSARMGTMLHAFAKVCINLHQKLPRSKKTLNMYVNDAIGFGMTPEQVLYFSDNCFGTADAITFNGSTLRIHDLKTGKTPAHMEQLDIYAALFCLEYNVDPASIEIVLRLYQNDEVTESKPEASEIIDIMERIIYADRILEENKEPELSNGYLQAMNSDLNKIEM